MVIIMALSKVFKLVDFASKASMVKAMQSYRVSLENAGHKVDMIWNGQEYTLSVRI